MLPSLPGSRIIRRRDPRLALYPQVLNDGSAGVFRDLMTNVNATLSGGSTLTGQEKFRNDFQRLTSTFPTLGYRASPAWTNLLYVLNADAPSFEGGTVGGWTVGNFCALAASTQAQHGVYSLQQTVTAPGVATAFVAVTAATAAGAQYTAAARFKGVPGKSYSLLAYDDVASTTGTAVIADGTWQLATVTRTFDVASVTRRIYIREEGAIVGEVNYWDSLILVAGSTVPQFEESECVATSCTFPTPFTVGEPFSAAFYVFSPWPGDDGALHTIFDSQGTAANQNRILVQKTAANNLEFNIWDNATNLKQCSEAVTAVNWPAGTMKKVTVSRTAAGVLNAFLNGVVFGTLNAGAGTGLESALGANSYIGTDNAGANQLNGVMMPYMYEGYAWSAEEHGYYSTLQAPPPRTRMVA